MYPRSIAQQNGRTEAVPVKFAYVNPPIQTNNNEASSDFEVPIHKNNQVGVMPTMVEPGRGQLTQEEVFTSKGLNREGEVALMTEPGASAVALLEKAKSRTNMASPSKLAVGQTTGARKAEYFPLGSTQEEKVKPKPEKVPTTKTFRGPRNAPRKDQSREAKERGVDFNTRVSNYITSAKIRIRTMSNVGGTKGAGQKDGGTDHFGNFIQRAKMKIRTLSGIGVDKNVQSK